MLRAGKGSGKSHRHGVAFLHAGLLEHVHHDGGKVGIDRCLLSGQMAVIAGHGADQQPNHPRLRGIHGGVDRDAPLQPFGFDDLKRLVRLVRRLLLFRERRRGGL